MKKITRILILFLAPFTAFLTIPTAHASPRTLSITNNNASHGTVTGPGINCGSDCSESIEAGTAVTLTATPQPGRVFVGASTLFGCPYSPNGYSSAVTCNFTISSDEPGSFYWAYASYSVTASKEGAGSGTVAGTGTYAYGSYATLTATPSAGSVFVGWQTSGDICTSGGKGSSTVNTSPTCTQRVESGTVQSLNAVARFDKASPSPSPSTNTGSSSTTNTPSTAPQAQSTKPAAPNLEGAAIEGTAQNIAEKVSVSSDKPLVLSGKTVPNGKVALFIFSEPKRYDITADAEGKWSYSISGLPEGDHHAEIEVTDPATNLTSDRAKLLEFTILARTANPTPADNTQNQKESSTSLPLIIAGVFIILAGASAAGFIWWRRKRKETQVFNPFDHQDSPTKE